MADEVERLTVGVGADFADMDRDVARGVSRFREQVRDLENAGRNVRLFGDAPQRSAAELAQALDALGIKARALSDTRITVGAGDLESAVSIIRGLGGGIEVVTRDAARGSQGLRQIAADADAAATAQARAAATAGDAWSGAHAGLALLSDDLRALQAIAAQGLAKPEDVQVARQLAGALESQLAAAEGTVAQYRELSRLQQQIAEASLRVGIAPTQIIPGGRTLAGPVAPDPAQLEREARQAADTFVTTLKAEMTARLTESREALFRGAIDKSAFAREAREAGQAFNTALLGEIDRLAESGRLTEDLHVRLVRDLREDGLEAGRAMAQGIASGAAAGAANVGRAAGGLAASARTAQDFTLHGNRAATTAIAVAFGLEAMARGSAAGESGIRAATRSVATFAAMFGTPGIIASGILVTADATYEYFNRARAEMEKTTAEFFQHLNQMRQAADVSGLSREQQRLFSGFSEFDAKGALVRTEGIQQLRAQVAPLEAQLTATQRLVAAERQRFAAGAGDAQNMERLNAILGRQQAAVDAVREKLDPLEVRYKAVAAVAAEALASDTERNDIGRRLGIERDATRERVQFADREARAAEQAAERERRAAESVAQSGEQALLALRGDRAAALDAGRGLGGGEFQRSITALVAIVESQRNALASRPLPVRLALETTREDLEREIRAVLPNDNVFTIQVRAQVGGIFQDLERQAQGGGPNQFLDPDFRPGGRFDSIDKFLHPTVVAFESVARSADQVERAFQQLPALADSTAARFAGSAAAGLGGAAGIGRGVGLLQAGGLTNTLSGLAGLTSGVLGVAGGLTALVGVFTQESARTQENNALLEENSEALKAFRLSVSGFNPESGEAVQHALVAATALAGMDQFFRPGINQDRRGLEKLLNEQLADAGITREQFLAVAKDRGVNLLDKEGRVNFDVLKQNAATLADILKDTADDIRGFGKSFDEQTRKLELGDRIFGRDTPADDFNRQVSLLTQFDKPVGQLFAGIDATTAAGVARAHKVLQGVFDQYSQGLLDVGQLDKAQFLDLLGGLDSSLDSAADAADKLTQSLSDLNVPVGFAVTAFRVRAQDPIDPFAIGNATTGGTLTADRPLVLDPVVRPPAPPSVEIHVHMDGATVTTAAKSPDEFLAALFKAAGTKSRNSTGLSRDVLLALARALGSSAAGLN